MDKDDEILSRFEAIVHVSKQWDGAGDWREIAVAGGIRRLERILHLTVEEVARDGLQARLVCRKDMVEADVYAQLEMSIPEIPCYGHFQRVSWRPLKLHTNGAKGPQELRLKTFRDRREPLKLNRHLGIAGLRQLVPCLAEPLLASTANFRGLLMILEEFWCIDELDRVSDPPWEERLL